MTTTPGLPAAGHDQAVEVPYADGVLAGRAMSSAVFLAGLIANAQLETVGRPDRLPEDLFPHVDPEVVRAVWDRALAVGLHAGRRAASPGLYADEMARVQGQFEAIGFVAMGRSVERSRRLVAPHPADGETARERSASVMSSTSDTSWEQGDK